MKLTKIYFLCSRCQEVELCKHINQREESEERSEAGVKEGSDNFLDDVSTYFYLSCYSTLNVVTVHLHI